MSIVHTFTCGPVTLYQADCADVLLSEPAHAVVTDPPYGLEFMGQGWDGAVPPPELWEIISKSMRPGAHLAAFGGTRTYHRLATAIETAGLEIRDQLVWLYGQGFPKSLNVSRAIDRARPVKPEVLAVTRRLAELRDNAGVTNADIDAHFGFNGMAGHWTTQASQPAVPTDAQLVELLSFLDVDPDGKDAADLRSLIDAARELAGEPGEAWKNAEVVKTHDSPFAASIAWGGQTKVISEHRAPNSESARQWEGFGTALKPANEPIALARKPLAAKTVAQNVQRHEAGALNIDAARVGVDVRNVERSTGAQISPNVSMAAPNTAREVVGEVSGRWPANVVHDGSDAVLSALPTSGSSASPKTVDLVFPKHRNAFSAFASDGNTRSILCRGDAGSVARFFYCAKPKTAERDYGLDDVEPGQAVHFQTANGTSGEPSSLGRVVTRKNLHPTVKPIELMRWLCRLLTPPGGLVFDPFMGSGTTGIAAVREGFRFVGVERDAAHFEIARKRIERAVIDEGRTAA